MPQDRESLEGISMITELQVIDSPDGESAITLEIEDGYYDSNVGLKRRYPLSRELMIRMLDHGMEVEDESETAITLIHLFILWTTEDVASPEQTVSSPWIITFSRHVAEKKTILFDAKTKIFEEMFMFKIRAHAVNTQSFKEELSSEEDLDEWLKAEMEKHISKQDEKNKEDALIAIIKSIREECRAVHKNKQISVSEGANLKKSFETMEDTINNDSFTSNFPSLEDLNPGSFLLPFTINNYNSYVMANIYASNNVMPRSIYEYLKPANLGGATMSVEMDDMTQQETLGTVKNVLVKIDKFEFPCDFVVTDVPKNLGEMIILGRPFLETIHAQMDVFQEEISLGISEDRIKFDVNGNPRQSNITVEKIFIANTSQEEESFNPLETGQDLFSYESPACLQFEQDTRNYDTIDPRNEIAKQTNPLLDKGGLTKRWHVCKPVQVFYDDRSGKDCGMWPTYDSDSSFCYGYKEILDCFDVEEEYAKKIRNPYSRRFDEYKRVFDNEVENLSNQYTLRIGKKGYVLDDV
ncbi:reverse transcriptase domain-containing protein [Tanacetum coccineum]